MVHDELTEVKRIARAAGTILMQYYRELETVEWKAPGDPVTIADLEASDLIVQELQLLFPDDAILSEEMPDSAARLSRRRVWMVDPMDGTREFIEHREDFAVQIGLTVDGSPTLGVVFQPSKDKLYSADRGRGAHLESGGFTTRLEVSAESAAANLTIALSRSQRSGRVDRVASNLRIPHSIRMGGVGLKVGIICEGGAHIYVHLGDKTHIWDTCAPEAILREAGGTITDAYGKPLDYRSYLVRNPRGVVASNGRIHDRALTVIERILSAT
jgi:3'(2'), 5'-bisphosphate nucleotidase